MKRIFYILYVAVLLGGCQKHELGSQGGHEAERLEFNASVDGMPIAKSRAAGVDTDLKANGFFLAGYHTEGLIDVAHATAYPNVFDREIADQQLPVPLVKYESGKFTLKTIKWALDDATYLSFFGWSQSKPFATSVSASTTGIIGQTYDKNDTGYPWLEVRNADAPLEQSDVVGSRSIDHQNDAVLSAVDLDFRHLLSKLTFRAKSSFGANITFTAVNIKYAANKVRKKARYTFGSDPAQIGAFALDATEFQAGTQPLNTTYPAITSGGQVALGSVLIIPQQLAAGDVSIELKYKLSPNSGNLAGAEQTKTLPLSAFTPEQGNNYVYTIDIQATDVLIMGNPVIEGWDVVATPLPIVPGPRDAKTLLLLDGYDKPYTHSDGKKYWLDRSGWNRHVELVGYYDGQHNQTNHCYTFNNTADNYGLIPAFPSVTALSVNVVTNRTPGVSGTRQTLLDFHQTANLAQDNDRRFWTHMGNLSTSVLYFDCSSEDYGTAGKGRVQYNLGSVSNFEQKSMWSFTKQDNGAQRIFQNANLRTEAATSGSKSLGVLQTNVLGRLYGGSVYYLKVTAEELSQAQIQTEFSEISVRYNMADLSLLPPVKSNMIFCFDGRAGLETIDQKLSWRDIVGGNHAQVAIAGAATAGTKSIDFNGTNNGVILKNPFTLSNDYTLELVIATASSGFGATPIIMGPNLGTVEGRYLLIHVNYASSIVIDAPGINAANRFEIKSFNWNSYGGMNKLRKIVVRRQRDKIATDKTELFFGTTFVGERDIPKDQGIDVTLLPCTDRQFSYFGWCGQFYVARLYNRALTDDELRSNYEHDKVIFEIPD